MLRTKKKTIGLKSLKFRTNKNIYPMTKNLSPEKLQEYKESFKIFDKDEDGRISTNELKNVLNLLGKSPSEQELWDIISEFDKDGNGTIEFDEFVELISRLDSGDHEEENLKNAFEVFDKDGNGYIDKDELKEVMKQLGENLSDGQILKMMKEADGNSDGLIDFNEFKNLMKN